MNSILFILALTTIISGGLWLAFKEDYEKDNLEYKVTVLGVLFAVSTFTFVGQIDMPLGLILAVFIIFLRKHFWEDYKTKREKKP